MTDLMKIFVVHVYDAADHLHDYYAHQDVAEAKHQAAIDVVTGRFDGLSKEDLDREVQRVIADAYEEPGIGRWHVRCDAWRAHIDDLLVRTSARKTA